MIKDKAPLVGALFVYEDSLAVCKINHFFFLIPKKRFNIGARKFGDLIIIIFI